MNTQFMSDGQEVMLRLDEDSMQRLIVGVAEYLSNSCTGDKPPRTSESPTSTGWCITNLSVK